MSMQPGWGGGAFAEASYDLEGVRARGMGEDRARKSTRKNAHPLSSLEWPHISHPEWEFMVPWLAIHTKHSKPFD